MFKDVFVMDWKRKIVAIIIASIIWILVNHSITITKTFSDIPVRITHLPENKTVSDILPSGILERRITLTLTASKKKLEAIDPSSLEVVVSAEGKGDQWLIDINKRDLFYQDPDLELVHSISQVAYNDFLIQLEPLIEEKIPIRIKRPFGESPEGYQFLDVWPQYLFVKIKGPQKKVNELKKTGINVTFDLRNIDKVELDKIYEQNTNKNIDEIVYSVPDAWKYVPIPFFNNEKVKINDPEADFLQVDFLREELLPLNQELPIDVFYSFQYSHQINPETYPIQSEAFIRDIYNIKFLSAPLYVKGVSRLFLETVRKNILIVIMTVPKSERNFLPWSIQFVSQLELEEEYVKHVKIANIALSQNNEFSSSHDNLLRERFREYMRNFKLYLSDGRLLQLNFFLKDNKIRLKYS